MADIMKVNAAKLRARLLELFDYDAATGHLVRRVRRGKSIPGSIAGSINPVNGYREITIDYVNYRHHRLVWLLHTGEWPNSPLDHINRCRNDDRFDNLRLATVSQNTANSSLMSRNTSGFKGVSPDAGKWRASIMIDGRHRNLGAFDTPEDAHNAYMRAARKIHGDFATDGRG